MYKKIILLLMCTLIISILTIGCGNKDDISAQDTNDSVETKPPYINENFTYQNTYTAEEAKTMQDFYSDLAKYFTDEPATTDLRECFIEYVTNGDISRGEVELMKEEGMLEDSLYSISFANLYGHCLENTNLVTCFLGTEDGKQYSITLVVYDEGEGIKVKELKQNGYPFDENRFRDTTAIYNDSGNASRQLKECNKKYPQFKLSGILFEGRRPIGYNGDDPYLKVYNSLTGELENLENIPPVKSISEGQLEYDNYYRYIASIISDVPFHELSYNVKPFGNDLKKEEYYTNADSYVCVRLFDKKGNKGNSVVCVYYSDGKIIAEVTYSIHKEKQENANHMSPIITYTPINEIISSKDENGNYVGLDKIIYVEQTNDWLRRIEDLSSVKGMHFNGKEYVPVFGNDEIS